MRKGYFINDALSVIERAEPETVELRINDTSVLLTKDEFKELCSLDSSYNGVKFVAAPKAEPEADSE